MGLLKWLGCALLLALLGEVVSDTDYNVLHKDGSYEFSYDTPDSFHRAEANRYNVVKGQFGGRSPKTGGIDVVTYTAGPRGFRPQGKNIARKYDLSQVKRGPIGNRDDPYYDPYEDPSYNFGFRTKTYNRQESANRRGDVTGKYSYIDDVGEQHNVEYIAGKNTGFHVKTPVPDSNVRLYGPLFFRGRGKPLPRGRTSIQRGLDGSYRFISAGPDQRRVEVSDARGVVRGSYAYLDDKAVQHTVYYIAGPEIGYRVLKNIKGPHYPNDFPFNRADIVPSDFYNYNDKNNEDVFDTAASGHVKPPLNNQGGSRPNKDEDYDSGFADANKPGGFNKPVGSGPSGSGINKPSYEDDGSEDVGDLFGDAGSSSGGIGSTPRPGGLGGSQDGGYKPSGGFKPSGGAADYDDGSYKPSGGATGVDDGAYKPSGDGGAFIPDSGESGINRPSGFGDVGGTSDNIGGGGSKEDGYGQGQVPNKPNRPAFGSKPSRPQKPSYTDDGSDSNELDGDFGLFGSGSSSKPGSQGGRPSGAGVNRPGNRPSGGNRPSYGSGSRPGNRPGRPGGSRPGGSFNRPTGGRPGGIGGNRPPSGGNKPGGGYGPGDGLYGGGSSSAIGGGIPPFGGDRPTLGVGIIGGPSGADDLYDYRGGTIITNLGDTHFSVPPGVSVRAHVQAIDLLPLGSRIPSPSEQFMAETNIRTEQLSEAASNISNSTATTTDVNDTETTTTTSATANVTE